MKLLQKIHINLTIFLIILAFSAHATEQIGDKLIINNDTCWIEATPLEDYLENKGSRIFGEILLEGHCSALWRGYVATWELKNDSLFLIRIQLDYCSEHPKDYDISKEFNKERVFVNWINRTIRKPEGKFIQHGYYYDPIHEGEILYSFENGILVKKNVYSFIEIKNGCIFSGETFLSDTIKSLIINKISYSIRNHFNENETSELAIHFDRNGKINRIYVITNNNKNSKDEEIVLATAIEVLQKFPKICQVNHPRYEPQSIRVNINGYCLKNNLYETGNCNQY